MKKLLLILIFILFSQQNLANDKISVLAKSYVFEISINTSIRCLDITKRRWLSNHTFCCPMQDAYFAHNLSEQSMIKFYEDLDILGFENLFVKIFTPGFNRRFNEFIKQPIKKY